MILNGLRWKGTEIILSFLRLHPRKIDGETLEAVSDFIFLGSEITADGDCSHEIKRRLVLGRKVMTNLDSILKSRDITLPTKVPLVNLMATHSSSLAWKIPWTKEPG